MSQQPHDTASDGQDATTYQYEALNLDTLEIRLLVLQPAKCHTDEIQCFLTVVDLLQHPRYECLSYTWDEGLNIEPIKVSNKTFLITPGLKSFLAYHRSETEPIELWVDAICINQSSDLEKSSQVKMMNMIYTVSTRLTIWLGPETDDSSLAIQELKDLGAGSVCEKMSVLTGAALAAVEKLLRRRWWSRIWAVQEVLWGGLGSKIQGIRVFCGTDEISWIHLAVAASRMKVNIDDHRQFLPAVENILQLEELRNQAEMIIKTGGDARRLLYLVSLYRDFQATDPRDKIYALMGTVFRERSKLYNGINVDYSLKVREVYMDFAIRAFDDGTGLEVLRHCRASTVENLPSWVPDWSGVAGEKLLPGTTSAAYNKTPWWLKVTRERHDREESTKPDSIREGPGGPGQGLPINNGLPGNIQQGSLPQAFVAACPPDLLNTIKELSDSGKLVIASMNDQNDDEDLEINDDEQIKAAEEMMIRKSELLTLQTTETREKVLSGPLVKYTASGDVPPSFMSSKDLGALKMDGILFDTIVHTHEPFVDNVSVDWENSTYFMVAVGECKQLALFDHAKPDPYSSFQKREKAFWLTLLAGRTTDDAGEEINIDETPKWLPSIPPRWNTTAPRVTAVHTGRLKAAELGLALQSTFDKHKDQIFPGIKGDEFKVELPAVGMTLDLLPTDWSKEDCDAHKAKFNELSSMWQHQPFDLYHRPFALPTVLPDPFWEIRQKEDHIALSNAKKREFEGMIGGLNSLKVRRWTEKELRRTVPIVSEYPLSPGFEKYALGRRFFVTKKGYLGLGPKGTKVGDTVSVLMGSDVPFVLRKSEISDRGWKLVGETYVHGIMAGEVIDSWRLGNIEAAKITLL